MCGSRGQVHARRDSRPLSEHQQRWEGATPRAKGLNERRIREQEQEGRAERRKYENTLTDTRF